MKETKNIESIFTVTFTNSSSIFIKAMDEAHARRIVEKNGSTWTRADDSVEMVIEKIEASETDAEGEAYDKIAKATQSCFDNWEKKLEEEEKE